MVQTRRGEHNGSTSRSQEKTNKTSTVPRRSTRKSAATPAGTLHSPDHVLNLQFDSAAATKPAGNKSKSRIASTSKKSKAPTKPVAPINAILTPACLCEIFKHCEMIERRFGLPLVCKHWAEVLRGPSVAWEVSFTNS
jgi:hypothetical protein